jgi:radical SAM peptide maturase (CXXX-repeat target family)
VPYKKALMADEFPCTKTITFMVTEECNLRCSYCYEENKCHKTMPFDIAKRAVDLLSPDFKDSGKIYWEFIGGEPLLEIDLVDQITDYILQKSHKESWKSQQVFFITTNGTLLGDEKVRKYLLKDKCKKSVGLSLDGPRDVHNINRCDSWDVVMANFGWWRRNFPWCTTKSTVSQNTLPHLFRTIKFLTDLELTDIFINLIYEAEWTDEDAAIYYDQLILAADYLIDSGVYETSNVSLFHELLNTDNFNRKSGWCGCGNSMLAISPDGGIYPCLRFYTGKDWIVGDVWNGINNERITPFQYCHNERNSECRDCELLCKCPHCLGWDYQSTGSIFNRSTNICKMFKAQVKANQYFFGRINK